MSYKAKARAWQGDYIDEEVEALEHVFNIYYLIDPNPSTRPKSLSRRRMSDGDGRDRRGKLWCVFLFLLELIVEYFIIPNLKVLSTHPQM